MLLPKTFFLHPTKLTCFTFSLQLQQALETISSLMEENKQLRGKRDRLEQMIVQKVRYLLPKLSDILLQNIWSTLNWPLLKCNMQNQEIAESMKSVIDARREGSIDAEIAEKTKARLVRATRVYIFYIVLLHVNEKHSYLKVCG
jgi:hypothetical protein